MKFLDFVQNTFTVYGICFAIIVVQKKTLSLNPLNQNQKMKLEIKVLDYINHNQQGVRVSEMEIPLGENRMRLGYVAKNLLKEGKIAKVNNTYFPKTMIKKGGSELSHGP